MRKSHPFLALLGLLTLTVSACTAPAPLPRPSKAAELKFTGVWVAVGTWDNPAGPEPWSNTPWPSTPPFTPAGEKRSRELSDIKNVVPCQPGGPVFAMGEFGIFPIEVLEAPDRLVIKAENIALPRRIYMDGRSHPEDMDPNWMGHSIGKWEGDVLVVDTVGLNGMTRAMNGVGANAGVSAWDAFPRLPASDKLHLVERLRVVADGEILQDELTITDPVMYSAPIVVKHHWQRRPDIEVMDYFCGEKPRPNDEVNLASDAKR